MPYCSKSTYLLLPLMRIAVTPFVFCAVLEVITDVPNMPLADIALKSAWIPAPPPESAPAIVNACFITVSLEHVSSDG